jgi:hypothetical protein
MRRREIISSAYALEEARKLLAVAAARSDSWGGHRSQLVGDVSEEGGVRLQRRLVAPESHLEFRGRLASRGERTVLDGCYVTARFETTGFAIIGAALVALAIVVQLFSLRRGTVGVMTGSFAALALTILAYRVIRYHRETFRLEADSLGDILREILGEEGSEERSTR